MTVDDKISETSAGARVTDCLQWLCGYLDVIGSAPAEQPEAVEVKDIPEWAGHFGLTATPLEVLNIGALDGWSLPVLVVTRHGAMVVVEVGERVTVYDAENGDRLGVVDADAIRARGRAYFSISVGEDAVRNSDEPENEEHGNKWFWRPFLRNLKIYGQVLAAAFIANIMTISVSIFTMVVYDRILPNDDLDSLVALGFGVGIAIVFEFLLRMLRGHFIDVAGKRADMEIGRSTFGHLLGMQLKNKKGSTGSLAGVIREFETLRDFFTSASMMIIVDLPFMFIFITVMFIIGGPLVLVPIIFIPILLGVGLVCQPILSRLMMNAHGARQDKQGVLVETVSAIETIKAIGAGPIMRGRWEDAMRHSAVVELRSRRLSQFLVNMTSFTQHAAQATIVTYGVVLVSSGSITPGVLMASMMLMGRTMGPLNSLAQVLNKLHRARAAYRALSNFMDRPSEKSSTRHYLSRKTLDGAIEFRNVTFAYPDQISPALNAVSFSIKAGEKVAIIGKTGSGKSTIARLILGLYDPREGAVLIDHTDMRQIDPDDLRANIAAVLQDVCLFSGSIRRNIAISAKHASDEDVLWASKVAGVHDFVSQQANGYDFMLSERGEGLSGGQKQTIAIARAVIRRSPVIVMDEPTSSMDTGTENALVDRLAEAVAGRTFIVITHRPAMLKLVDRIIVIEGGRVISSGPTAEVVKRMQGAAAHA